MVKFFPGWAKGREQNCFSLLYGYNEEQIGMLGILLQSLPPGGTMQCNRQSAFSSEIWEKKEDALPTPLPAYPIWDEWVGVLKEKKVK